MGSILVLTMSQNKELEASEERKRKAKQLELQRKEMARNARGAAPRMSSYQHDPTPARPSVPETYDARQDDKPKPTK